MTVIRFFDEDDEGISTRTQDMLGEDHGVDRRVIRDRLDETRKYWTRLDGTASTAALADEIIALLVDRYGIKVCDSDWS